MMIATKRVSFFILILILFTLACVAVNTATPMPVVNTPTPFSVIIPYPNVTRSVPSNTPIATATAFTPEPFAQWVVDFAMPVLASLEGAYPSFQDDFSDDVCIIDRPKEWKICATPEMRLNYQYPLANLVTAMPRPTLDLQPDLQKGFAFVNHGWFFMMPDSEKNPFYARVDSGVMFLKLPEGKINKDLKVYSPFLLRKNFVLQMDFEFTDTQPQDIVRFEFNQSAEESFALDLSKNKTWSLHWGNHADWQSRTGTYEYFSPEYIRVLVIMRGTECAVYVNNDPLDYIQDCRQAAVVQKSPQAVSIHLIGRPGYAALITVDNVVLWDLDNIINK